MIKFFCLMLILLAAACGRYHDGTNGLPGPTGSTGATGDVGTAGGNGLDGQNGVTGPQGNQGTPGAQGVPGTQGPQGATGPTGSNASGVTVVKLCPGITTYPSTFTEIAFCVDNKLYATYSANGGFSTEIPPGSYSSNGINSNCVFTVGANCSVTNP